MITKIRTSIKLCIVACGSQRQTGNLLDQFVKVNEYAFNWISNHVKLHSKDFTKYLKNSQ
ncbi:MAG: YvbH-like oligomerization domain-containing protein [Thomasclavelia ramosa]